MNDEFREMELAHCQRLLAMIEAALEQVPQAELLAAFERIRRSDIDNMAEIAVLAWREQGKGVHRQQLLEERSGELERAEANNRRLLAQSFVRQMSGRKDVRPLEGQEATCQAIEGDAYCSSTAVAEVFAQGGWRPVCAHHLEGV